MFNNNAKNYTWRKDKIKHDRTTRSKANKGLSGIRAFVARMSYRTA